MRDLTILLTLALTLAAPSCSEEPDADAGGGGHTHVGPHGGDVDHLGSAGHVEIVHDAFEGTLSIWVTGPDAKTALAPDAALVVGRPFL